MRLHRYIARKFLAMFALVTLALYLLAVAVDSADIARNLGDVAPPFTALQLGLLKAPAGIYSMLPMIAVIAALWLFLRLARTSELVITRAAGRSGVRTLGAPVLVAIAIGIFAVVVLNPLVAVTRQSYDALSSRLKLGEDTQVVVGKSGLWLREGGPTGTTVIHAREATGDGTDLTDVTVFRLDAEARPIRRNEARSARLGNREWILTEGKTWRLDRDDIPEASAESFDQLALPSRMTRARIIESFEPPQEIAIWDLPAFIARTEAAGFSTARHRVHFQSELAKPFLLAGMVIMGAAFVMRHARFGRAGLLVLVTLAGGFGLFFLRNFAQILGENGSIPVILAAWAPPLVALSVGAGIILHLEDG